MRFVQTPCKGERVIRSGAEGRLILGDGTCPPEEYKSSVQCVYIDPPFNTGEHFTFRQRVGAKGWELGTQTIDLKAYTDRFESRESYHAFLKKLIIASRDLLNESGSFFLHLDQRESAWGRLLCDEVFGEDNFVNEIIWCYQSGGRSMKRFSAKHDTILFYRRSKRQFFDIHAVPIPREGNRSNHMRRKVDENGRSYRTIRTGGKLYTYYDDEPTYPSDVWSDVSHLQQKDPQRTGYDTQKPMGLLKRIIACTTRPGDLVADLCCGSGTALAAAAELERRYLGMDTSLPAVSVTRKRLQDGPLWVDWPACDAPCGIRADAIPGIGFSDVYLLDYTPPAGTDAGKYAGLDLVDSWAVGFLRDGWFFTQDISQRLKQQPELKKNLSLPQFRGQAAIQITDVFGNKPVFAILDEE